MSNIIYFTPKGLTPADNLKGFIDHCKKVLSIYEGQGGFNVDDWRVEKSSRKISMRFGIYAGSVASKEFEPFAEPFLSFAKSIIRYKQELKESKSISNEMDALKALYDALIEVHGEPDVLRIDGIVQHEIVQILDARLPESDRLYRIGGSLEALYKLLIEKGIAPSLPAWKRPWKRGRAKAGRTDKESVNWQEERCPSQHHMLSLADCFAKATSLEDQYWSSVLILLMFAPGRGGELQDLTVDCYGEEDGKPYIRWVGEKGFGTTIKWIPEYMVEPTKEAVRRLTEIGQPARDAAKFAYENPGTFMRHSQCITPGNFPENKPLDAMQFCYAMGQKGNAGIIEKKGVDFNSPSAWSNPKGKKWVRSLLDQGPITYQSLAQHTVAKYKDKDWPNLSGSDGYIWNSLLLVRDCEFHNEFSTKSFSWEIPSINRLNDQLDQRPMKNPLPTIFQRFGIKDEDGGEIALSSHQLRVWLSTMAERGGMDSWQLAQWAGRSRIQDNRHYDLRTKKEREDQARQVVVLTERPNALESVKLNLPVAYHDLGVKRIGVADVTEYGMCVHDYGMSPCTKGGECMTCKEHVCVKGMPKTLERIKRQESMVSEQLEKAKVEATSGVFGADRWVTHLGWKLSHISTQRMRIESEDTPEGAVLWIPPEHDPSPVKRALEEQGYKSSTELKSPDVDVMKKLMEL